MRIRVWNAFASNNSGSYVIVGNFPTEALATEVAAELLDVGQRHSQWRDTYAYRPSADAPEPPVSPLAELAVRYAINWADKIYDDDWPEHSGADHPAVWSIGHQVFVHSPYTVSMPSLIGHVMYERGGRVATEIVHAHHPLVAVFEIVFHWKERKGIDVPARVRNIVDLLCADDGALSLHRRRGHTPAWRGLVEGAEQGFGESDLVVGAVFDDLAAGFAGVAAAVKAHGALLRVSISEARGSGDPLAFLRPCVPPTRHALVDVVLVELGLAPTNVVKVVSEIRALGYRHAHEYLAKLPAVIAEGVPLAQAEAMRTRLAVGNAVVSLQASTSSPGEPAAPLADT